MHYYNILKLWSASLQQEHVVIIRFFENLFSCKLWCCNVAVWESSKLNRCVRFDNNTKFPNYWQATLCNPLDSLTHVTLLPCDPDADNSYTVKVCLHYSRAGDCIWCSRWAIYISRLKFSDSINVWFVVLLKIVLMVSIIYFECIMFRLHIRLLTHILTLIWRIIFPHLDIFWNTILFTILCDFLDAMVDLPQLFLLQFFDFILCHASLITCLILYCKSKMTWCLFPLSGDLSYISVILVY